jgi:hypothetical protein
VDLADPSGGTAPERFDVELRRTVDRVRGLALTRLEVAYEPEPTRADAVRTLAQRLADAAAELEGEPRRALPVLAVHGAGDQLAVCGHDLRAAAGETDDAVLVTTVLDDAAAALQELRRRL